MKYAIVGGGILGLATAHTILREEPGSEVVVLERAGGLAEGQTGHNSGVVHAGIYYAPGSLKARLCRRGMALLREFCAAEGIAYDACGKLVVATEEGERARLEALRERATANQVPGLRWLEGEEMREVEPQVSGVAALHSPETAIVDFVAVAAALARRIQADGGEVRTGVEVSRVSESRDAATVELVSSAETVAADRVVVCAGLHADGLARASGQDAEPRIIPFRGEYWKLRPGREDLVRGLIYPVPDPALPFLGVHLTRKIDGEVWLGPNAVLALALEGYRWSDVSGRDLTHIFGWPGTWRMMRANWRAGVNELSNRRKGAFIREARRFVPALRPEDVVRAPAGVRAQAVDRDGSLVDDFRIGRGERVTWVRNAPSPGATSSLAIAEELVGAL
ncbi:MAG: L-2-hydroxyglutarate oxidase [Solirubrobacterales bacterium]